MRQADWEATKTTITKDEFWQEMLNIDTVFDNFIKHEPEIKKRQLQIWFKHLGKYPAEFVREAIDRYISTSSYTPKLNDILTICKEIARKDYLENSPEDNTSFALQQKRMEIEKKEKTNGNGQVVD